MCSDEVQRGLYFAILGACFALYRIFVRNKIGIKSLKGADIRGALIDVSRGLLIPLVFFVVIFSGSSFLFQALKGRMALQNVSSETVQSSENAWNFAVSYSMHPFELIDSLAFGFHGNSSLESANPYWGSKEFSSSSDSLGFFVIIFALLGIIVYYKKSGLVKFFFFGALFSLLLSFGRFWPGLPFFWIFYHLPYMSNFRDPIKILCVTAFCLAVLSAFGLKFFMDLLSQKNEASRKMFGQIEKSLIFALSTGMLALFIVLVTSSDIALGFSLKNNDPAMAQVIVNNIILSLLRMDIFLAVTLALVIISFRMKKLPGVFKGIVIPLSFFVMMIIDLWTIDLYYVDKSYIKLNEFYRQDKPVAFMHEEGKNEPFRVLSSLMLPGQNGGNLPLTPMRGLYLTFYFSFFDIQAMEKVASSDRDVEINNFFNSVFQRSPSRQIKSLDELLDLNLPLLRLSGVKYLVTDGYLYSANRPVALMYGSLTNNTNFILSSVGAGYDGRQEAVFEVKNYIPRLALFENFQAVEDNGEALKYLSDPKFDFTGTVIVNIKIHGRSGGKGLLHPQAVTSYKDWDVKADIDSPAPGGGVLLFNTRFDPGWKAFIDGKPVQVYKANYLQMAVFVDGGKHAAEFRYEPGNTSFFVSFITVIAGIAGALCYGVLCLFFKKKGPLKQ